MASSEHAEVSCIAEDTASCVDEYDSRSHSSEPICNSALIDVTMEEENYMNAQRPPKRHRQKDLDEVWTTVTRRGKRIARSFNGDESIRIPDDKIEVNITSLSEEKLPKQFRLAKILKAENILDITRVKYINSYKVIIQFSNEISADRLMDSKYFKEKGFKCQRTLDIKETYGVIKNIDLDSTEEEILECLRCEIDIVGVKRLKRRNSTNGQWEPSEVIRICFKGSMLPTKVYIFDTVTTVSPYEFPVTQCSRCWRYGHKIRFCPSNKVICPKCSGHHDNCDSLTFKCSNCHGKHMALARICPIYKKEKRIRELMAEFHCSYKRALTVYVPPEPTYQQSDSEDSSEIQDYDEDVNYNNTNCEGNTTSMHTSNTYADALKKTAKNKAGSENKKGKSNRKGKKQDDKNKSRGNEDFLRKDVNEDPQDTEEESINCETNKINWRKILKELKDKICDSNLTLEEKIQTCVKIIFEAIKQFMLKYLTQLPFFSYIRQWVTDTNS